ncbi:unnamed protein product, partial [Owenia fusiformis]
LAFLWNDILSGIYWFLRINKEDVKTRKNDNIAGNTIMKITTRSWINLTVTSTLLNLLFVVEQVYSNDDKNGCPGYVGYEGKLKSEAGVRFSIMIDNSFKCSGEVVAWQYYRCTAQDSIYVTTWTPSVDDARVFTLKTITELPPAPLGKYTTVKLDAPLQVEKDDVIGLAYKMGTKNGGLTWEQEKDDVNDRILDTNEYYKTHSSTKVFLDTVTIGDDVNVKTQLSKRPSLMNFSIRAVMSYGRSWRLNCGKVYNNEIIGPNKNELQMRKLEEYGDNWIMSFGTPKLSEYKTTKLISCIAKCIAKPECMSINFNKQYMGGQCNLYQLHKPRAPIHLYRATDKGWTMYSCIPK